jgi:hypothetical protein
MGNCSMFLTATLACAGMVMMPSAPYAVSTAIRPDAPFIGSAHPADDGDVVVRWNQIFNDTVLATTPAANSLVTSRSAALMAAAVFDAVNGIERRYVPLHVTELAPGRALADAAAVQASYSTLVRLYPAQAGNLTARRAESLASLMGSDRRHAVSAVEEGVAWGQFVADAIWTLRESDGFTPPMAPFTGSATLGFWRPTPTGLLGGSGPQFATMTPWVLTRPSLFRLPPPPALSSAGYAADYNETRLWGGAISALRQQAESDLAVFWNGNGTLFWTRVAAQLAAARGLSLIDTAHLFAVLHVSMADASIATWDSKYRYLFWRPVTAIQGLGNDANDGNDVTNPDPAWTSLLTTSAHPEYPSGHSNLAGAAATVLIEVFGDDAAFDATSEAQPGIVRSFVGFSPALAEMVDARVFGGMHFRNSCVRGTQLGGTVAAYVLGHAMQPIGGGRH